MDDTGRPSIGTAVDRWRRWFRRRVLLHRRWYAAALAAVSLLAALQVAASPPPATQQVWTAARSLAPGETLERGDLRQTAYRAGTAPQDAVTEPEQVAGRPLAVGLSPGEPVTTGQVVGPHLRAPTGMTAVPVRITDPDVAALLHPGDHVRLLAADLEGDQPWAGEARLVAPLVTVLAVPPGTGGGSGTLPGRLVVLAVPEEEAGTVSGVSARQFVTVTWIR